jgi:hypothetical protein
MSLPFSFWKMDPYVSPTTHVKPLETISLSAAKNPSCFIFIARDIFLCQITGARKCATFDRIMPITLIGVVYPIEGKEMEIHRKEKEPMKSLLRLTILSVFALTIAAGCSDGTGLTAVEPDIAVTGTPVTRTELVSALWSKAEDISPDALCLIGSTFEITSDTPFTIAMNEDPADASESDVIIISPVTITFDDAASDGRGAECGEGVLQYEIQASESDPIDIEVAEELQARHSLIHVISNTDGAYPDCAIKGHFDMAGREVCDSIGIIDDIEIERLPNTIAIRKPLYDFQIKSQGLSENGVPCGSKEIQSVKLVVDEHSCRL